MVTAQPAKGVSDEGAGRTSRGFTLIEMMTVLAIVGLLFGLAFSLSGYATRSAQKAKASSQVERLGNAIHNYFTTNGVVPAALTDVTNGLPAGFTYEAGTGTPMDPWGNTYQYRYPTNTPYSFLLFSYGPDGTNSSPTNHIVLGR